MKGVTARLCLVFGIFLLPTFANAQVVINEVMYNPAGSDSGREWVELYNQGQSDVTMVGGTVKGSWRISDGSNHTLADPAGGTGRGSLTIPAGGYLIIANDPTDFISGEYAGGSYSVVKSSISLNNTGATISLLDGNGATVDSTSYTNAQGGADDGTSLQRQADGSWLAALPTPGALNSTVAYVAPPSDSDSGSQSDQPSSGQESTSTDDTEQTSTQSSSTQNSSYVPPPTPDLFADAGQNRTVIVGADTEFDASAYDKDQNMLDPSTVRFSWNFGDGSSAEGPTVLHDFAYPGRYAVVLNIASDKTAASDEVIVTAEPAQLSFSALPDGSVSISNDDTRDLDLSSWIVRAGPSPFAAQFILPAHSIVLAGSSMRVGQQTLGFSATSESILEYPNGSVALASGASTTEAAPAQEAQAPLAAPSAPAAVAEPSSTDSRTSASDQEMSDMVPVPDTPVDADATSGPDLLQGASSSQVAAAGRVVGGSTAWWIAAAVLALAAAGALVLAKYFGKGEWDIIEEKPE